MRRGADSVPLFAVEQEYSLLPNQSSVNMPAPCDKSTSESAATGAWPHAHLPNPMCPFLMTPSMEQGGFGNGVS